MHLRLPTAERADTLSPPVAGLSPDNARILCMPIDTWVRFTWDLGALPPAPTALPQGYACRPAEPGEEDDVVAVALRSYTLDPEWANVVEHYRAALLALFNDATTAGAPPVVFAHGRRIVGVSVLCAANGAENHLLSGPCLMLEYRSRGFGSSLLEASLHALRAAGLTLAHGITRDRTTAARHVYPRFGGRAEPWKPASEIFVLPEV